MVYLHDHIRFTVKSINAFSYRISFKSQGRSYNFFHLLSHCEDLIILIPIHFHLCISISLEVVFFNFKFFMLVRIEFSDTRFNLKNIRTVRVDWRSH